MRTGPLALACGLVGAAVLAAHAHAVDPAPAADPAPADWDAQNAAMGYLVLHLSNLNAVNGLNLTRDQAARLRDLARQVEAAATPVPRLDAPFRADLGAVRNTYLEVRRTLLAGAEVTEALREKAGEARAAQARVARLSLVETPPAAATGCARCHVEPRAPDVRAADVAQAADAQAVAPQWPEREVFMAHHVGLFGLAGTIRLAGVARQVDAILTPEQKEVLRRFSCCVVPPKDLADPVRAGQADAGELVVEVLRHARRVPQERWPVARAWLLDRVGGMLVVLRPGTTDAQKDDVRRSIETVVNKARDLSETDFELEKADLARQLTGAVRRDRSLTDAQEIYTRAMFLMVPGAAAAYDALVSRLDGPQGETR